MSVFSRTERTARKRHRCCFCQRDIAAGERYVDGFCILDGQANPWKGHLACQAIGDLSTFANYGEGIPAFVEWDPEDIAALPAEQQTAFKKIMNAATS